jgi:hypothetical protein
MARLPATRALCAGCAGRNPLARRGARPARRTLRRARVRASVQLRQAVHESVAEMGAVVKKSGKGGKGGGSRGSGGGRSGAPSSNASLPKAGLEQHANTAGAVVAGIGAIVTVIWLVSPPVDTDRVSALINSAVPAKHFADTSPENGKAIAKALNLRKLMQDIVDTTPGASFVTEDPPIIHFDGFMTPEECEAMIEAGKPGLKASTGTGQLKDGKFERTMIEGRTSYNSWCMKPSDCPDDSTVQSIDSRIANVTGFSYHNMEYYQILRYAPKQEYQAHSDWIEMQKGQPSVRDCWRSGRKLLRNLSLIPLCSHAVARVHASSLFFCTSMTSQRISLRREAVSFLDRVVRVCAKFNCTCLKLLQRSLVHGQGLHGFRR